MRAAAEEEEEKHERGIRDSKDERRISTCEQTGVSYDKCPPLYPLWEYSALLSYQLPVCDSGPTDTRWPSVNQPVGGSEPQTADSDRCSLSAPIGTLSLRFIHPFWIHTNLLKGKETPCGADMNQAFCVYTNSCLVVRSRDINLHWMRGNNTRYDREYMEVDTL